MAATSSDAAAGVAPAAPPAALRWRLRVDPPGDGARNMAVDHALASCLQPGQGVLRLYGWARPTVSFGRNEPAGARYDRAAPAARGLAFVRRPTGGRAVLHDREVTYAVVVDPRAFGGVRAAYRAVNAGLVRGLAALGVAARVADRGVVAALDAGPCFQAAAPGEVVAGGRKLVGSAQARVDGALLQHGSVLLDGSQEALEALAVDGAGWAPPATVRESAGEEVAPDRVVAALAEGCRLAWGGSWAEAPYTPLEYETADRLEAERYARPEWTWRR